MDDEDRPTVVVLWGIGVDWRDGIIYVAWDIQLVGFVEAEDSSNFGRCEDRDSDIRKEIIGNLEGLGKFEVATFEEPGY